MEARALNMSQDQDHLRLLSVFHYVVGGIAGLFSFFPVIHLVLGLLFIFAPEKLDGKGQPPPPFIGWFFVGIALLFMAVGWTYAVLVLTTGRFLARRKHYLFCLVMGGVECIFMPFGTVLGIFTIVVLMRETVKGLFTRNPPAPPAYPITAA